MTIFKVNLSILVTFILIRVFLPPLSSFSAQRYGGYFFFLSNTSSSDPSYRVSSLLKMKPMFFLQKNLLLAVSILPIVSALLLQTPNTCISLFSKTSLFSASSSNIEQMSVPKWYQKTISITAPSRGCHLITSEVTNAVRSELSGIKIGMANLFIQHTSASLTINENADPDVRVDLETALNKIVPETWHKDGSFTHTMEGPDDMTGHVKSSLMGPSLNIPISNGRLALGTWQGIYLNEHRNQGGWGGGHTRNIVITLQGTS